MRQPFLALGLSLFCWSISGVNGADAAWKKWYDGSPGAPWWEFDTRTPGGVLTIYRPGQRITSIGGVFLPRKVIVTDTPAGVPVTTTFVYPSAFHSPNSLRDLQYARGIARIVVPDAHGLLYVDGNPSPRTGASHLLTTPLLEAGQTHVFHLRAAFRSGNQLLIEDRALTVQAGQQVSLTFDGANAVAVSLPQETGSPGKIDLAPPPRRVPRDSKENP
jgi:uncharacterized protein (TIGR03000 family)